MSHEGSKGVLRLQRLGLLQQSVTSQRVILFLAVSLVAWLVLCRAWMYEDAYITFRTVANFVHGHGLRWNVDQRVQTYTHPLWMLLHIPLYAALGNMHLASFLLTLGCAFSAFGLLLHRFANLGWWSYLLLLIPIAASRTFIMYATSGFEIPLTWLLLVSVGLALHAEKMRVACVLTGFVLLNRLDLALLVAPLVAAELLTRRIRLIDGLWVALPASLWALFSLLYYGFAMPNTSYAKLGTGVHWLHYARQGGIYAVDLFENDPTVGVALLLAMLMPLLLWRQSGGSAKQRVLVSSAGIALYCAYVVRVGGDHSAFRMWASPAMAALITLGMGFEIMESRLRRSIVVVVMAGALAAWLALPEYWITGRSRHETAGIYPQHNWMYESTDMENIIRLIRYDGEKQVGGAENRWLDRARKMRSEAETAGRPVARVVGGAGIQGFYSGPDVRLIDVIGLGDVLLARLPVAPAKRDPAEYRGWRIGHFAREVPPGYEWARETGATDQMDPALEEYWAALHTITSEPVWNWNRLTTLLRFNLGHYEALRNDYVTRCIENGKC